MPSCIRAPADSTNATTGTCARPGDLEHAHDRVGVALAERAAEERRRPGRSTQSAGQRRAGRADDAVARPGPLAQPPRDHPGSQQLQTCPGRTAPRAARAASAAPGVGVPSRRHSMPSQNQRRRCGHRRRKSSRSPPAARRLRGSSGRASPGTKSRSSSGSGSSKPSVGGIILVAQPRASRRPRPRPRRRAGGRSPTWSRRSGSARPRSPQRPLQRRGLGGVVQRVEVPWALT